MSERKTHLDLAANPYLDSVFLAVECIVRSFLFRVDCTGLIGIGSVCLPYLDL
jgi:hypothetical protein